MKRLSKRIGIILISIFSIISFVVGFGLNEIIGNSTANEKDAVGIYHTNNWNNHEATLFLNEDGICKYPGGGEGTWNIEKDIIEIKLPNYKLSVNEYGSLEKTEEVENYSFHTAYLVENGIMLHDHFFEKK